MRRRQKKVDDFLNTLKVGDKIVTSGGLYGSITKLGETSLQLQVCRQGARRDRALRGRRLPGPATRAPEGAAQ
jgi:hypothetical protein